MDQTDLNCPQSSDHFTKREFFEYYATQSQQPGTIQRLSVYRDTILTFRGHPSQVLDVADLGCGAGTQSLLWAERGHRVHGLDISRDLLQLARERARAAGYDIDFRVASAAATPWPDRSMDVCLAIELLEHVVDWDKCLDEMARLLRPGGVLLLTTTNKLCPRQQEFELPLYSWYPRRMKRHYERLAATTRPELVNHATHPALHWFTFYGLRAELERRACQCHDRFDLMDLRTTTALRRGLLSAIRTVPGLRWFAHVATPYTWVLATKA